MSIWNKQSRCCTNKSFRSRDSKQKAKKKYKKRGLPIKIKKKKKKKKIRELLLAETQPIVKRNSHTSTNKVIIHRPNHMLGINKIDNVCTLKCGAFAYPLLQRESNNTPLLILVGVYVTANNTKVFIVAMEM
jgi:hypothetical protein